MKELNDSILALVMDDTEEKLMAENTEIDKEELGLACPKCGKRIIEDGTAYRCEAGDFKCGKEILGTEISRDELQKAIAGQSDELGFRSSKTGKTFLARLVLSEAKDSLDFRFSDRNGEDSGLKCPKCGGKIVDDGKAYKCESGDFKCWKIIRGHEITREELQKALDGKSDELGFTSRDSGKPYKGRLVLNEAKDGLAVKLDSRKSDDTGLKCPKCGGKIIDDGKAYKCESGDFKCWKSIRGHEVTRDELQKVIDEGSSDELDFTDHDSGKSYKAHLNLSSDKQTVDVPKPEDTGEKCPNCRNKIMETDKAYWCESCNFTCDKEILGTRISHDDLHKIVEEGNSDELDFTDHDSGKSYKAHLNLSSDKQTVDVPKPEDTGEKCPNCRNKIMETDKAYWCESCNFTCDKEILGTRISHDDLHKIVEEGNSDELDFTDHDSGKSYKARLNLSEDNKTVVVPKPKDTGIKCPKCTMKIMETDRAYWCESEACDFTCDKEILDTKITRDELKKVVLNGKSGKLDFTDKDTKKPYKGRLVLNKKKNGLHVDKLDYMKVIFAVISFVVATISFIGIFLPDLFNMNKGSITRFETTLSDKKSAQKLEEFLDANVGKIVELTIHYKQNLVYGLVPWAKYSEDSYYGVKYDPAKDGSWWWDSASAAHDVTFSHFGDNNRFYVKSFLYDKNLFEVEYRDFGGIGYCDAITRYAYQLMIPYVKNDKLAFEWQRDREKSKDYVALPSPYWVLKGTFVVNVKKGEELTDNITTLYDEFQQRKLRSDYGKDYVVPEIAKILAVDPACGERTGNGDYSFSGKSFELEPLTQQQLLQMAYN